MTDELEVDRKRRKLCHAILAAVHEHNVDSEDAIGAIFDAVGVIYLAELKLGRDLRTYITGDLDLALAFYEEEASR